MDQTKPTISKWLSDIYHRVMDCYEMLYFLKIHVPSEQHDNFLVLRKDIERLEKKVNTLSGPFYGGLEEDKHDT